MDDGGERGEFADLNAKLLEALDEKGRWVTRYSGERLIGQAKFRKGERSLGSEVFCLNLRILAGALEKE